MCAARSLNVVKDGSWESSRMVDVVDSRVCTDERCDLVLDNGFVAIVVDGEGGLGSWEDSVGDGGAHSGEIKGRPLDMVGGEDEGVAFY